jgi:hypothetical protein
MPMTAANAKGLRKGRKSQKAITRATTRKAKRHNTPMIESGLFTVRPECPLRLWVAAGSSVPLSGAVTSVPGVKMAGATAWTVISLFSSYRRDLANWSSPSQLTGVRFGCPNNRYDSGALAGPREVCWRYHSSLTPNIIWRLPPVNCLSFKNRLEVTFA